MGATYTATERLALTCDDDLVPDTDPRARQLYCVPGRLIPIAEAIKYGLVKPGVKESAPEATKEAKPQGTKRRSK